MHEQPWAFGFYTALRFLENLDVSKPRIGEAALPSQECVRLGHEPSLIFANSTLSRVSEAHGHTEVVSQFLGLLGPNGPLPTHLTEYVFERLHNQNDPTLTRFLDIFHHRSLVLFYRAWANAQPALHFDRPGADRFSDYVGSLAGLGTRTFRDRDALPDFAKLHFAGLFARQRRDAESLELILGQFLGLPVMVEQFNGEWLSISEDDRTYLGERGSRLGVTSVAGARVWSAQHKIRIVVGDLHLTDFERLLPGRSALRRLTAVMRLYSGDELAWDVQLKLVAGEVPGVRLGQQGQLGWTSWLGHWMRDEPADDAIIRPHLNEALEV